MGKLIEELEKMKHCPLCHKHWKAVEERGKTGRVMLVCTEPSCMISIWIRDPALANYEKMMDMEPVPCPNPKCDEKKMRIFYRSDGYMKLRCAKCTASIEEYDPDKHGKIDADTPIIEEQPGGGVVFTKGNDFEMN